MNLFSYIHHHEWCFHVSTSQELTVDVGRWMVQLSLEYCLFLSPLCFIYLLPRHKDIALVLFGVLIFVYTYRIYLGTIILHLPLLKETLSVLCAHAYMCECAYVYWHVWGGTRAHITRCLLLKTSKESSQESLLLFQLVETVLCWWVFCARYSTINGQEPLEPFFCLRFSSCFTIINTHLHIWLDLFTCLFI